MKAPDCAVTANWKILQFSSVTQSCSTLCDPCRLKHASFPSIINSRSVLIFISIELVMPSNHLFLCHPFASHLQSLPASRSFPMSQFFASGGQSIGVSALESVLPMNIEYWFPLGWTGWVSLQFKELSRILSNITVQMRQLFGTQLSL